MSKKLARRGVFSQKSLLAGEEKAAEEETGEERIEEEKPRHQCSNEILCRLFLLLLDFSLATKRKVGLKDAPACFDTSPHNRQDVGEKKRRGAQRTT